MIVVFPDYIKISQVLLVAVDDPPPRQVVRRHLNRHLVARQYPDIVHPHLAGDSGHDLVVILQADAEHRVGQGFFNNTILLNQILFGHSLNFGVQR